MSTQVSHPWFGDWLESLRSDLDTLARSVETPEETILKLQEGERREVAVLFLDFEGFSQLSEMLDPEDVHLIVDRTFKVFTQSVEQYRGYVDKYEGDALLALFGSLQAGEDDCARAVHAAMDILEKLGSINQILAPKDIQLTIRQGIHTGLVRTGRIGKGREGDFTVMGDAVNLTRRIQEMAPPNGILISREVENMVRDTFLMTSQGKKTVKGRDEPVEVYRVEGLNPDRRQRWERALLLNRAKYVGRNREATLLRRRYRRARSGGKHHSLLWIHGAPGIGKSRLVHEFLVEIQADRATRTLILKGQTPRYSTEPFGLFASLIRSLPGEGDQSSRFHEGLDGLQSALRGQLKSELTEARPILESLLGYRKPDPRIAQLPPQTKRMEITLAIITWLEAAAERAYREFGNPLVVALDDLQWMDDVSLDTLDFVLSRLTTSLPCVFLLVSRSEIKLSPAISQYRGLSQIPISTLDDDGIRRMITSMIAPQTCPANWMQQLISHAGGNPLFAEELTQALADRDLLRTPIPDDAPWPSEVVVPKTVQGLILSRIDRLPSDSREIIRVASVLGREMSLSVLVQILKRMGYKESVAQNRLKDLSRRDLLRPVNGGRGTESWWFPHVLIQETVNSTVLNVNKRIVHRLAGEALESMDPDSTKHAAVLAYHFMGAGEAQKAMEYLLQAIQNAKDRGDYKEGIRLADQGISFMEAYPSSKELTQWLGKLHLERARLLNIQGDWDQLQSSAEKALKIAHAADDHARCSAALNVLFWSDIGRGKLDQAGETARRALKEAQSGGIRLEEARALTNQGVVEFHRGEMMAARDRFQESLTIFEEEENLLGVAGTLSSLSGVHHHLGNEELALHALERSIDLRRDLGDHFGQVKSLNNITIVLRTIGLSSQAADRCREALEVASRIGDRTGEATALLNRGTILALEESYVEALRDFNRSLQMFRELGYRAGEGEALKELGKTHLWMRHTDLAWDHLQLARDIRKSLGQQAEEIEIIAWLARTALEQRKNELSLSLSSEAVEFVRSHTGIENAAEIYYQRYLILNSNDQDGTEVLNDARKIVLERADAIEDKTLRQSFLESVPIHRDIMTSQERLKK